MTHRIAPGPHGGLLGCGRESARDPLGFYARMARNYGEVVRIRAAPGIYYYLVTSPTAVEYVLHDNQKNYHKGGMFNKPVSLLAGHGLPTREGDEWRQRRRLIQPIFHRQSLATFATVMNAAANTTAQRWSAAAASGTPVDVVAEMTRLTLQIASQALFSVEVSGQADSIALAVRDAFEHVSFKMKHLFAPPEWLPTARNRRFLRARSKLDNLVYGLIWERRQSGADQSDLLSTLLAARVEETGTSLTDEQVRDEVLTLLLAGHETTSAVLSWVWYLLSENPAAADQIRAELDTTLGDHNPDFDTLAQLTYTRMVVEEALRLYPPAWGQPRQALGDDEIEGFFIPAKSIVMVCQWVTHRNAALWQNPEQFEPERFTLERSSGRPRFAYYPFGGGGRICIGAGLAMAEAQIALAVLARRFDLRLIPNQQVIPDPTFTLRPEFPLMMTVSAR